MPRGDPEYSKLFKVQPLIDSLYENFLALYDPHRG